MSATDNTKGNLWSTAFKDDLYSPKLSPDGKHLLVYHGDTLLCIEANTGNRLWTKTYKDVERNQHYVTQFTKPDEAFIPGMNSLVWVDLNSGKELASVPTIGELGDIEFRLPAPNTDYDTLQPTVYGDLMVVWYSDGTQVIDLKDKKVIYQTSDDPTVLRIEKWFSTMMLDTESDTLLFIDGTMRSVVYKHDNQVNPISTDLHQRFFDHKNLLVVLTETNMIVVDKTKGQRLGTILVSPEKTENYIPIVKDDKLYLLVTTESVHEYFDVETQKRLWSIDRKNLDGIADQTTVTSDGDLLVQLFDEDDVLSLAKINTATGKVLWSTKLVTQDGGYEAGHIKPSTALKSIASFAVATALNRLSSSRDQYGFIRWQTPYKVGPGGILTHNGKAMSSTIDPANLGNETMNGLTNRKINKKRTSQALFKVIGVNADQIHLLIMGEAHQTWKGKPSSADDGEGVATLDAKSGKVVEFKQQKLFADNVKKDFNLFLHGETIETANGLLAIGASTVCYVTNTGEVSSLTFDTEDLQLLDTRGTSAVVYGEDSKSMHQMWKIDFSTPKLTRNLVMYSDDLCDGVTRDTIDFHRTITLFDGAISAYEPLGDLPKSSDKIVWKISEDDISKMKVGDLDADSAIGMRQGIRLHGDHILLLGDDGYAVVDATTGACRKSDEWNAKFNFKRDGMVFVKNAAFYQSDTDVGMVALKSACDVAVLGREMYSYSSGAVLAHKDSGTVIFMDSSAGTLNAYRTK
ncbi:MAG: PQQ-binding-like beta-propeller repeat protein [bacterium]|nr:PQQ-binding-like beta-propeller repeat protein [bacterium]